MKTAFRFVLTVILSSVILSGASYAGVPDGLHYMVSPPSCQPEDSTSEARLELINGVWQFKSNATHGDAVLYCPVSFYGNVGEFNNLQLWYKANAPSPYSLVRATLMSRNRSQPGADEEAVVTTEDANTSGYGFVNNFNISGGPTTGNNFFVRVLMFRNTTQEPGNVAFVGLAIDIKE